MNPQGLPSPGVVRAGGASAGGTGESGEAVDPAEPLAVESAVAPSVVPPDCGYACCGSAAWVMAGNLMMAAASSNCCWAKASEALIEAAGLNPQARAETVDVAGFLRLADAWITAR